MGSIFFVFLVSLTLSGCVKRFPRQLPGIEESKQFRWGDRHALLMNRNGTVEVKLSQEHNCEACKVQLRPLCEAHRMQVKNCLKSIFRNRVKVAATAMTMKFTLARKYLCLHRNKTFYAVAHTDASNLEECTFYIVQERLQTYTSIYHFKYPHRNGGRDCRLKQRRACHKFYLRKGKGDILTVTRKKSFNESRWIPHGREII